MKVIIAMDSFKATLTACQACEIVADAITKCAPDIDVVIKPMADGGEGTANAILTAAGGRWVPKTVMGPLPEMQVEAGFAWFEEDKTALVEMASASGLELLLRRQLNPLKTTTYGTGQLIKAAAEQAPRKILLAVGGSATVDGGLGAAAALGWKFPDHEGQPIPLGGAGLEKLETIIEPKNLNLAPVEVLCDVDNPLCGEHGAAKIYGPQKGATPQMVEQLEKALANLAELVSKQLHRDIKDVPGAGAAGGLAAGAMAFMNAALVSGIETIMNRSNIKSEIKSADWVITGEGSFDGQSLRGKVVSGIAKAVAQSNAKLAIIAGRVAVGPTEYKKLGVTFAIGCQSGEMSLDYALKNCRPLLAAAARKFAEEHLI